MTGLSEDKITVHIADDHQMLIDGLTAVLQQVNDIEIVGSSIDGHEILEIFKESTCDILLLDINMPQISGIEVLKEFQNYNVVPKVIVLSSYDDIKLIKDVIKLGAKAFVQKKSAGEHIVNAIRTVHKGGQYFTEEVKEKMLRTLMSRPKHDESSPEGVLLNSLTRREYQILKLIAQQMSTKEMSESLHISPSTVETHRKNLLKKLNFKNSVGLALLAARHKII